MESGWKLIAFTKVDSQVYAQYKDKCGTGSLSIYDLLPYRSHSKRYPNHRIRAYADEFPYAPEFFAKLRRLKLQIDESQGIKSGREHTCAHRAAGKQWEIFLQTEDPDTWFRFVAETNHGVVGEQNDTLDTRFVAWMNNMEDFKEWEERKKSR
ncbi:hypothetical protein BDP55DRAFT_637773 [Colletotrichum godetiae]|uniref:Uncharacterized protein n=1 Tax=Colletotrichum godetiae TaxID=1209918 RepID=A0AAJ0ERH5_9PEZI|nr:uncharacterized protein BDP55DRAFT_637773 [Colletotrichum godetiae]KAK1658549.1 hypothetical protein BDP55DRAFT_637773 [Colletotrichum godetiae]